MDTIEFEYVPGQFVTCKIIREIPLQARKAVELLIWNPLTQQLEYIYDFQR